MELKYRFITAPDPAEIEQIIALYRMADWWNPEDDDRCDLIPRLIAGSHCFHVAMEGNAIVAMGRAISDGVNDAYIQDVAVAPSQRHRNIGTQIVEGLVRRLRRDGLRWIGLIASSDSHPFYEGLGFVAMPFSTSMIFEDFKNK